MLSGILSLPRTVARFKDDEMASVHQQNPYRCDQCGTPDIIAIPLLYQQGTRAYSGPLYSGSSQSYSARAAAPPRAQSYARPLFLWGFAIYGACFLAYGGFSAHLKHPNDASLASLISLFLFLGLAAVVGLLLNLRRISRYNRQVYPRSLWDWEHTYRCRRCGNLQLIPSR